MNWTPKARQYFKRNNLGSQKGLLSVNCRWQALGVYLDATIVVIVQMIVQQFLLGALYGLKLLQVEQLTLVPLGIVKYSICYSVWYTG